MRIFRPTRSSMMPWPSWTTKKGNRRCSDNIKEHPSDCPEHISHLPRPRLGPRFPVSRSPLQEKTTREASACTMLRPRQVAVTEHHSQSDCPASAHNSTPKLSFVFLQPGTTHQRAIRGPPSKASLPRPSETYGTCAPGGSKCTRGATATVRQICDLASFISMT